MRDVKKVLTAKGGEINIKFRKDDKSGKSKYKSNRRNFEG